MKTFAVQDQFTRISMNKRIITKLFSNNKYPSAVDSEYWLVTEFDKTALQASLLLQRTISTSDRSQRPILAVSYDTSSASTNTLCVA